MKETAGSTSFPLSGHFVLMAFFLSSFFSSFLGSSLAGALNSATFPMKSSGLAANLPQQFFQQKPISCSL